MPSKAGEFAKTIDMLAHNLPVAARAILTQAPRSPFTAPDLTAVLLGHDLWYPPLAHFRDEIERTGERPHLWEFEFGSSGAWDSRRWKALSLPARLVRARAGAVDREVQTHFSADSLGIERRALATALEELTVAKYYGPFSAGFAAVATPNCVTVDLSLIRILAHWLVMLQHRERILADRHATGFEVHGYAGACSFCASRWGVRPFQAQWAPPFHPACRCFAQPRFSN